MIQVQFEKAYKTASASYTIRIRPSSKRMHVIVELFSDWSTAPLWSTVEPLANFESLSDAMFRKYKQHVNNEISIKKYEKNNY